MSLVGDALRKARREAAEREVERRGVLYSARIADTPGRSQLGLGLVLGALIAVVATAAGGVLVWWLLASPGGELRAAGPDGPVTTVPTAPPGSDDSGSDRGSGRGSGSDRDGDSGGGPQQQTSAGAVTGAAAAPPPSASRSTAGATGPVDPDPVPGPETEAAAAPPSASGAGDRSRSSSSDPVSPGGSGFAGVEDGAEVYILEAEVGGVRLELDYIVFRAEDPFAEINGVEVHAGGTVGGFRVTSIEADRVRLTDGRRDIVLRAP